MILVFFICRISLIPLFWRRFAQEQKEVTAFFAKVVWHAFTVDLLMNSCTAAVHCLLSLLYQNQHCERIPSQKSQAVAGPYTGGGGGIRGGSDEPPFRLGSCVIDSHLPRLDLNSQGEIAD